MNTRVITLLLPLMIICGTSCTKYNYVQVKAPTSHLDKTMWEYLSTDSYNWHLTQEMIKHAGLQDLFEGKSQYGSDITFFGITDLSIKSYLFDNQLESVRDIPADQCKEWILTCVYPKAIPLEGWKEGAQLPGERIGKGGEVCTMLSGKKLWIYAYREPYNGVVGMGPKKLYLVSMDKTGSSDVASHNIATKTGIVHSLAYTFKLNDF